MLCPSCGLETSEGKYCTNCGAQLTIEEKIEDETRQLYEQNSDESNSGENAEKSAKSRDLTEKLKTVGEDFGHFFTTLVKSPIEARKANHTDTISGIITIVIMALLLAISYFVVFNIVPANFIGSISFFDGLILPFISFGLLQFLIAVLTFVGVKLAAQAVTFPDVIAKYGAYLIPFLLLYVAGLIFLMLGISVLAGLSIVISILGFLLFVPTFILLEQPAEGFDRIYVLLGLYIILVMAFGFFTQSFVTSIIGNMMDSIFRGF